ncbi:ATP-binding protein [Streptomyces flaveus]|uniref:ATP-binding protein n=1 Tax=Streptomyces flaveus TaxID=66370 RepID=A0A917R530_9ACTN|nr:ATP-binding protein [Streptomyces flaveus]
MYLVTGVPPTHADTVTQQQTTDTGEPRTPAHQLTLHLSSTRRGARLARQLAVQQFTEWTGLPHDSGPARTVALATAELASNAITHGNAPGRDFRLTLLHLPRPTAVRIEVTDTRPERLPPDPASLAPPADATSGRGLLLVQAYADRWGCTVHDAYTKTVWAEVSLQQPNTSSPLRTERGSERATTRAHEA